LNARLTTFSVKKKKKKKNAISKEVKTGWSNKSGRIFQGRLWLKEGCPASDGDEDDVSCYILYGMVSYLMVNIVVVLLQFYILNVLCEYAALNTHCLSTRFLILLFLPGRLGLSSW
jgi:hypothetical protein